MAIGYYQVLAHLREAEQAGLVKADRRARGSVYGWQPA
jgi:hypothetical protein